MIDHKHSDLPYFEEEIKIILSLFEEHTKRLKQLLKIVCWVDGKEDEQPCSDDEMRALARGLLRDLYAIYGTRDNEGYDCFKKDSSFRAWNVHGVGHAENDILSELIAIIPGGLEDG